LAKEKTSTPDVIRPATRGDCDAIAALNGQLGYDAGPAEIGRRLDSIFDSQGQAVLVAEVDGRVVGWIFVAVVPSLETEIFAEIRGLIVGDRFRGAGIGARLVSAGEEWARRQGVSRIRVRSNVNRDHARRFYERAGYTVTKTQNVFDREL
jgi:GNAT superfamily N-acetyltransferase